MKILLISHEKNLYGASQSLLNIIDELSSRHEFIVLSKTKDGTFQDEVRKRGVRLINVPYYVWERNRDNHAKWVLFRVTWILFGNLLNYISSYRVKKRLLNEHIDIIHCNTSVISIGRQLKKVLHAPLIWHIREFGKEDFGLYPLVSERSFYKGLNEADGIIFISKAIQKKYSRFLNKPIKRLIYNGVNGDNIILEKKYHEENNEKVRILIAGKLTVGKGQTVAINAANILYQRGHDDFELLIAGKGELRDIGISKVDSRYIQPLGQIRDMASLRKTVDLELVCSKSEGFGRVTIEAMMGKIPVIGSNSGGTPELIKDGYNGFLYEYGNANELADKIEIFLNNRSLLKCMGNNAFDFAKEYFLIRRCASEIEDFYFYILDRTDNGIGD